MVKINLAHGLASATIVLECSPSPQTSTFKIQTPEKPQNSNSSLKTAVPKRERLQASSWAALHRIRCGVLSISARLKLEAWSLKFFWGLDFGV
jgi:hypothetical protein